MTRIVHDNFPVERLPLELRNALGDATHVRLTVEDKEADRRLQAEIDAAIARGLADIEAGRVHSMDEIDAFLAQTFPLPTESETAA
jgi:predicted transcriptional regulator